jgi:hypothetical protein
LKELTAQTALSSLNALQAKAALVEVEVRAKAEVAAAKLLVTKARKERDNLTRDYRKKLDQTGHVVYDLPEGRGMMVRKGVYDASILAQAPTHIYIYIYLLPLPPPLSLFLRGAASWGWWKRLDPRGSQS